MNSQTIGSSISGTQPKIDRRVSTLISTVMTNNRERESPLKGVSKSVTRFKIKSDLMGSYHPVNVPPDYGSTSKSLTHRAGNLLERKY